MSAVAAPAVLPCNLDAIPDELKSRPQWLIWRLESRDDKYTKVPYQAGSPSQLASSTKPATWASFEQAAAAYQTEQCDGIGFVFSPDDPFTGVDIDHCVDATGAIESHARAVIDSLDSYAERSPSGAGVHIFARAAKPGDKSRTGPYEMYDQGRFFTVTGHRLPDTPETIEPRQDEITALYDLLFPVSKPETPPEPKNRSTGAQRLSDDDLIERARNARNGAKFSRLWAGDTSEYGGDESRADAALAAYLAFWTQDDEQVKRLMLRSGLYRDKYDREDYLPRTIRSAREGQTEHYTPSGELPRILGGQSSEAEEEWNPVTIDRHPWPTLHPDALRGLAGDIVRALDPHTEADPVATLLTFLLMFGSAAGRSPRVWIGEDRHGSNDFACLVGDTAAGRKGSSYNGPRRIVAEADSAWRIVSGLASGEGFVWQIRDPIHKANKKTGETELIDEGERDKRLFVFEGEFAKVLNQTERSDNTLSANVRLAWDGQTLQKLTLNPVTATDPHVSIIAHITPGELRKRLNATEIANGLGNRFLFACVRRSKYIPRPGRLSDDEIRPFVANVVAALAHARRNAEFDFTESAAALWDSTYPALVDVRPGMYGELTARRAPHAWRLALIYAALDCSPVIDVPHLRAAFALVAYCDASVLHLFGDATGDSVADRILTELRAGREMTATDVQDLFGRNQSGRTNAALTKLVQTGLIGKRKSKGGKGRPATVFYAIDGYERNEKNEESPQGGPDMGVFSFPSFLSYTETQGEHASSNEGAPTPGAEFSPTERGAYTDHEREKPPTAPESTRAPTSQSDAIEFKRPIPPGCLGPQICRVKGPCNRVACRVSDANPEACAPAA